MDSPRIIPQVAANTLPMIIMFFLPYLKTQWQFINLAAIMKQNTSSKTYLSDRKPEMGNEMN